MLRRLLLAAGWYDRQGGNTCPDLLLWPTGARSLDWSCQFGNGPPSTRLRCSRSGTVSAILALSAKVQGVVFRNLIENRLAAPCRSLPRTNPRATPSLAIRSQTYA